MDISFAKTAGGNISPSYPTLSSTANAGTDKIDVKGTYKVEAGKKTETEQELNKTIDALNKLMQPNNTHLSFILHEKLQEYYVQIVDNQTDEVIKEIPSKKILDMVAEMKSKIGLLIDEKR